MAHVGLLELLKLRVRNEVVHWETFVLLVHEVLLLRVELELLDSRIPVLKLLPISCVHGESKVTWHNIHALESLLLLRLLFLLLLASLLFLVVLRLVVLLLL